MHALTQAQCDAFWRDGFLALDQITTPADLADVGTCYDRLFGERAGWKDGNYFDLVGSEDDPSKFTIPHLQNCSRYCPELTETIYWSNAYSIASQLLGGKIKHLYDIAITKLPHNAANIVSPEVRPVGVARTNVDATSWTSCSVSDSDSDIPTPTTAYSPGKSGNPAGKPRGAKNRVLLALDRVGADNAQAILEVAVEAARSGDLRAVELILSRAWPARKGRPVSLALPLVQTAADLPGALAAVVAAVTAGDVTLEEGQAVAAILEAQRRGIELADHERRLEALEARTQESRR